MYTRKGPFVSINVQDARKYGKERKEGCINSKLAVNSHVFVVPANSI